MPTAPEIRQREFERWFVPETWDIHRANDPEAELLTDEIEMNLSEYSDGVLNREELYKELARIAGPCASRAEKTEVHQ